MEKSFSYSTPYSVDLSTLTSDNLSAYINRAMNLPINSRRVFFGTTTANYIADVVGSQFQLTPEQADWVTRAIRDVILGDIDMQDMPQALINSCGLAPEAASQLAQKVVDDLFTPIVGEVLDTRKENLNPTRGPQPSPPPVIPGQQVNPNNIIDLRQQNK